MSAATVPIPHGSSHTGRPSLLARYRSLREVRTAIEELDAPGIDGNDLARVGGSQYTTIVVTARYSGGEDRTPKEVGPCIAVLAK
jgi:hypothetical protein